MLAEIPEASHFKTLTLMNRSFGPREKFFHKAQRRDIFGQSPEANQYAERH